MPHPVPHVRLPAFVLMLTTSLSLILLSASTASAVLTIEHVSDTDLTASGPLQVGDTFNIDVTIASDDVSVQLASVFTAAIWDETVVQLNSSTSSPVSLLAGPNGSLQRLSNPFSVPIDPIGSIRTIQHGAFPGEVASVGGPTLVTTLNFTVVGFGDPFVAFTLLTGDIVANSLGQPLSIQSNTVSAFGQTVVFTPEPGTAILLGIGLAGFSRFSRRRR